MHIMQCDQIIKQLSDAVEEARTAGESLLDTCALVDAELSEISTGLSTYIEHMSYNEHLSGVRYLSDDPSKANVHTDGEGAV